jgi:C4-dicarboxylate transporter DctM subunit
MSMVVLFVAFFFMILIGVPIAVALGGSVVLATLMFESVPLALLGQKMFANLDHFALMAVPFFFLAAAFMESGGIVRHLVKLANSLVGHLPGGLGMTAILTCMFFAAISGSSAATVAAVGSIMYPALIKEGYTPDYAVGALATAGGIGILIPPSIPLILYGFVTETSIPKLFIAGILPGIFYGCCMMLMANRLAVKQNYEPGPKETFAVRWQSFREAGPALFLPLFLIIGIYGYPSFEAFGKQYEGGAVFTPTEAAIMCVFIALAIGLFIYRIQELRTILATIVRITPRIGMIFWIVTNAVLFGFYLTQAGVPNAIAEWLVSMNMQPWMFLLLVNLVLVIVGLFMDGIPTILMFMPVLFPASQVMGIDPVHFGIIVVVNIELGLVTPPVGVNLYVGSTISGLPIHRVFRACLPWIVVDVFVLLVVTYFPWLATFLPGLMTG